MRVGRLALKIYLYSIVTGLATIAIFVATFHILRSADRDEPPFMVGLLVTDLWQRRNDRAALQELSRGRLFPAPQLTLYDRQGRLIATTATPPFPMISESQLHRLEEVGQLEIERGIFVHPIRENGSLVGIGIASVRPPPPPGFAPELAWPLAALSLVLLVATMVFARHVARPLQRLANTARQFGRGELGVRSGLKRKDEIGELGLAFDDMAERVAGLMATQQELLVNVSHELLTPLSRIRVAVDLMTDGEAAQAKEVAPEITHDLVELERLLDDVMTVARLDLSRLQEGAKVLPLQLASTSVEELVQKAVSRFRAQCQSHQVSIAISPGLPALSADAMLLRRVIENLLDNARKYSDEGTTIRIRALEAGNRVHVAVADSGIGIDDADLKRVFVPFFRTDKSRSRSTGGVGLGLALARGVVEAHGGTIDIASKPGEGTTVTFHLPVDAASA
jgi:two-component system OmpR family sensor kinase